MKPPTPSFSTTPPELLPYIAERAAAFTSRARFIRTVLLLAIPVVLKASLLFSLGSQPPFFLDVCGQGWARPVFWK